MLHPNTYYHIYNHANGDDNLFREGKNYPFFLKKYHHHIDPIADTMAWCLMPNHFHLLVRIKGERDLKRDFPKFRTLENLNNEEKELKLSHLLSKQFANFFSSYSQSFNKVYKRRGSLFLKNFKRKVITSEKYLFNLILYIHLNPVKHGFTKKPEDWDWSSYFDFMKEQPILGKSLFETGSAYQIAHEKRLLKFKEYSLLENDLLNEQS